MSGTELRVCAGCLQGFAPHELRRRGVRDLCPECLAQVVEDAPDGATPGAEPPPSSSESGDDWRSGVLASPPPSKGRGAGGALAGVFGGLRESRVVRDIDAWAEGRSWLARLPLLLWFVWILMRHLEDPLYASIFDGLNLALHEIGHILFSPLGDFMGVAGGTIFQLLCPVIAGVLFYRQRDFFAIAVSLCWLAINFFDVAVYVGDARMHALPLVSPFGGAPAHDWTTMLRELDMLDRDRALARLFRAVGTGTMVMGLAFGGWVLWRMRRGRRGDRG